MGQRVYVLSQNEYSNILGIFTNIRQCKKFIETLVEKENIILHEIKMNEPQKGKINKTKLIEEIVKPINKQNKINYEPISKI